MIVALAAWMFWRTRREVKQAAAHHHHHHHHDGEGPNGGKLVDTGHGLVEVSVFETNVPPRFRLFFFDRQQVPARPRPADEVAIETVRPDGARQNFRFKAEGAYLEATAELPEPHEFDATLSLTHHGHAHTHAFQFREDEHHHHHHHQGLDVSDGEFQDAHEREHAADIAKRFTNRTVTTPQIVLFGLTGGLLPCPAALTILLVCLQLKKFTLGFALVLCFSLGLALTLVTTGALAAWGVQHAAKRFTGFGQFARKAPYVSSALLTLMGLFIAYQGWRHLP
jgi:nickel/cobalt exporter